MGAVLAMMVGLSLLVGGAELVVRYGSRLARQIGVPPVVVGLTVVSLGTSAPELAVAIEAARTGAVSLAIGNLAGANLANLLLLLGIIAAFGSIHIDRRTLRLDLPAVVVATAILWLLLLDGWLRWIDGVVLLTVAVAYLAQLIRPAKHQQTLAGPHRSEGPRRAAIWRVVFHLAVVAAGIVALVFGADWLVDAAVGIAQASGVSNAMIGLTVVALGTTMPELTTTIVSIARREPGIGLGNLLGSSIFNITLVLGTSLLFLPRPVQPNPDLVGRYIPLMLAGTVGCAVLALTRKQLSRLEGAILIVGYAACLTYVIVANGQ